MAVTNLSGRVFGRLTVLSRVGNSNAGKARWLCKCKCGKELVILSNSLLSDRTVSCGGRGCRKPPPNPISQQQVTLVNLADGKRVSGERLKVQKETGLSHAEMKNLMNRSDRRVAKGWMTTITDIDAAQLAWDRRWGQTRISRICQICKKTIPWNSEPPSIYNNRKTCDSICLKILQSQLSTGSYQPRDEIVRAFRHRDGRTFEGAVDGLLKLILLDGHTRGNIRLKRKTILRMIAGKKRGVRGEHETAFGWYLASSHPDRPPARPGDNLRSGTVYVLTYEDGSTVSGTPTEISKATGLTSRDITGLTQNTRKSAKGWRLSTTSIEETGHPSGLRHHGYDSRVYNFIHLNGNEFIGTQVEFRRMINKKNLDTSRIVRHGKSLYGWRLNEQPPVVSD